MLGGDWSERDKVIGGGFCFLALFGAVLIAWAVGDVLGANRERQENAPYYTDSQAKARVSETCKLAGVESPIECAFDETKSYAEARQSDKDLQAQETMATWAAIVGLVGFLQLAVSGIGLWALLKTIGQGREALDRAGEANEIARDAEANANRAWLQLEAGPLVTFFEHKNESSVFLSLDTTANNFGQRPATFVSRALVYVHAPGPFHLESEIARLAAKRTWRIYYGETIYPEKKKRIDGDVKCLTPILPPVGVGEPSENSVPQNYIGVAVFYSSGAGNRLYYVARFYSPSQTLAEGELYRIRPIGGECHGEVPLKS